MALRLLTALPFLTFANLRMKIDTLIVKKKERERERQLDVRRELFGVKTASYNCSFIAIFLQLE